VRSDGKEITVQVSEELRRRLEALSDKQIGAGRFRWSPELDAALLSYWPRKRHADVAKILGCSETTALIRWRELQGEAKG